MASSNTNSSYASPSSSTGGSGAERESIDREGAIKTPPQTPSIADARSSHSSSPTESHNQEIRQEDRLIPSIEPPSSSRTQNGFARPSSISGDTKLNELEDQSLPSKFGAISIIDTLKEAQLSPPESSIVQFGTGGLGRGDSPFTFRKLYNTTPEPDFQEDKYPQIEDYITLEASTASSNVPQPHEIAIKSEDVPSELESTSFLPEQNTKYDVRDETPPDESYFNPEFQAALKKGKAVAGRIEDNLRACELAQDRESQIYKMAQTAEELRHFDAPSVCYIGVVGDSGVGKFSKRGDGRCC